MAEYVDRETLKNYLDCKIDFGGIDNRFMVFSKIDEVPTADVIEREKIDKAIEEIHLYKHGNGNMFDRGMMKALGIFVKNIEGIQEDNNENAE